MATSGPQSAFVWHGFPDELVSHVLSFLPANEIACTARLVSRKFAAAFRTHRVVHLSQPSPYHAFVHHWSRTESYRGLTREQREKLVSCTAGAGDIANLQVALTSTGTSDIFFTTRAAAKAGHIDACQLLIRWFGAIGLNVKYQWILEAGAEGGRLHICQWAQLQGQQLGYVKALEYAALNGHPDVCVWAIQQQPTHPFHTDALVLAAAGGHEVLLWYLASHLGITASRSSRLLEEVALGCSLPVMQLFIDILEPDLEDTNLAVMAAASPTPDWQAKVEWLVTAGVNPRPFGFIDVAHVDDGGDHTPELICNHVSSMERIEFLEDWGFLFDDGAAGGLETAAKRGHVEVFKILYAFLEENGLDEETELEEGPLHTLETAARHGHLNVVKWAVETVEREVAQAGPEAATEEETVEYLRQRFGDVDRGHRFLGPDHMQAALHSGNIELLVYLRECGCPWGSSCFLAAVRDGSPETVEWLAQHGCPMGGAGVAYQEVPDLVMLHCLRRLGCPWSPTPGETLSKAIGRRCSLPVLRAMVEEGCPVDWEATAKAVDGMGCEPAVRAWVEEQRQRAVG
ncbi:hypothetical protein Agub_g8914 [Astrephomene gubernaculifera]|uniref:F-box domain-containing protein n=1 Tax=Astrephomene gubernaculifera TaxID=47775 RepID=A0AAD3DSH6_9CHLO|nr:hypothetical protein Agub_g8914 [Astrephomene gubernaculifera]